MRRREMIGAAGKLVLVVGSVGLVAACATGSGSPGNTLANLVLFNSTTAPAPTQPPAPVVNLTCPEVQVQDGTSAMRVYAGADQSNADLRYQYSLGQTARECHQANGQLTIKVGVAGRVLIGPQGAPSTFTVPLRVVIRRESDQKPAVSQLYRTTATIAPGDSGADFTIVSDELSVPYLHEDSDADYTILVGFDQSGSQEKAPPKRRKRG